MSELRPLVIEIVGINHAAMLSRAHEHARAFWQDKPYTLLLKSAEVHSQTVNGDVVLFSSQWVAWA